MFRKLIQSGCVVLLVVTSFLLSSCGGGGGGSDSSGSGSLSSAQAEAFAKSISLAATSSMSSSAFKEATLSDAILPTELQQHDPLQKMVYSIICNQTSCLINEPISARRTCQSGGNINVLGNISGTINNTGTGLILISATGTISDWSCASPFIFNGDPYVSLSGQFSFINGIPSTQQHVTINGGFKWGGTAAQSCQIHLDTNFNRNGGGRTTGTVCSHTVDVTF